MFKRRKRKGSTANGPRPQHSQPAPVNPESPVPPAVTTGSDRGMQAPPHLVGALREVVERAADRVKSDLASAGRITPTAFFAYADGVIKVVYFSFKGEFNKDALIRRIREKALTENASAVVILAEADQGRNRMIVLTGASPGVMASARVDYSFDKETKTITSWKIRWLNGPVHNIFLNGIFDEAG